MNILFPNHKFYCTAEASTLLALGSPQDFGNFSVTFCVYNQAQHYECFPGEMLLSQYSNNYLGLSPHSHPTFDHRDHNHKDLQTLYLDYHFFTDLALCMGALPCLNRKGTNINCCHKVGSPKISSYVVGLRFPFIGTKGHEPQKTDRGVHILLVM